MMNNRILWLALSVLLIHSLIRAEVQWFQYRTSDQAREIVGGSSQVMRSESHVLSTEDLPQTAHAEPLFFQWHTAMDDTKVRWIMLDKKRKQGLCDTLYIDSDGDGKLNDEKSFEGRQRSQNEVEFTGVPVYFDGEDGPVTYHLNFRFYSDNESSTYLYAYTGCWYEGTVRIGEEDTRFLLVDYNCNGTFDDKSDNFTCDRILIGPEESPQQIYVGNFFEYKGALYRPMIAKDGACLEITPAPEVPYAEVTMSETITSIWAGGINGMFKRTVTNGRIELPVGKYKIYSWAVERKDERGVNWRLDASLAGRQQPAFEVNKESPSHLDIGEPVYSKLDVQKRDGTYYFNQELAGRLGESISLLKDNRRPSAPKIHVWNKTGEYNRTFTLEYG